MTFLIGALLAITACQTPETTSQQPTPVPMEEVASRPPPPPCAVEGPPVPEPRGGWAAVRVAATSSGPVTEIQVTSTVPDELARSTHLMIRLTTSDGRPPLVFIDTSGDRADGGWTYQTPVSATAWNLHVDREGRLLHHASLPDRWEWEPVDRPDGFRWVRNGDETVICVPTDALVASDGAMPDRVRVAAEIDDVWLPAPFTAGISHPPEVAMAGGEPVRAPGRLAFAYQWAPWDVRDCDPSGEDLACASEAYGAFEHVVLAAGLEQPDHPSHGGTVRLIERLRADHPEQEVWGYVSMLRHGDRWYDTDEIADRAKRWQDIGVTGIFVDEFDLCEDDWRTCRLRPDGEPAPVTREQQRAAVEAIHDIGLPVFANAHSMHGVLGLHRGVPSPLGGGGGERPADMYLLENPTSWDGEWWSGLDLLAAIARFHDVPEYAARTGVRIAVVDTGEGWVDDDASNSSTYAASWWRAVLAGADAHAFTNSHYSAPDDLAGNLPILDPPPGVVDLDGIGLHFDGGVVISGDGWVSERRVVDAEGRTVGAIRVEVDPETGAVHGSLER